MSKRYAVLVGVSEYKEDSALRALPCAKNDALRLAEILRAKGDFETGNTYVYANGLDTETGVDIALPTRGNVLQRVKLIAEDAEDDDLILIFFAGHGAEISAQPYLMTADTKMDILQDTAINVNRINEFLRASKAKCILRIFDACRSPFADTRGPASRMTQGFLNAIMQTGKGWANLSSCSSGEVAHESGELDQGVFSYYLCEGLSGSAADENGDVTFGRLVDYVNASVANWSRDQSQEQTPHCQQDLSGKLVLTRIRPEEQTLVVEPPRALDQLRATIELHLSKVARDTRNLHLTTAEEFQSVCRLAEAAIVDATQALSHPCMKLVVSEMARFDGKSVHWAEFVREMRERGINTEYADPANKLHVQFLADEAVVPQTNLTIVLARFSFFYWVWYWHDCSIEPPRNTFQPKPRSKKGFFTFKPKAALDGRKVEGAVAEMFKRITEDIGEWCSQLGVHVDGRVGQLRKMGSIIE